VPLFCAAKGVSAAVNNLGPELYALIDVSFILILLSHRRLRFRRFSILGFSFGAIPDVKHLFPNYCSTDELLMIICEYPPNWRCEYFQLSVFLALLRNSSLDQDIHVDSGPISQPHLSQPRIEARSL